MGMSPQDYYNMLPKDFAAKVTGYTKRLYRQSSELRRAAFIIISPHVTDLPYEKYCREIYPLQGDEFELSTGRIYEQQASPEMWEALKKRKAEVKEKEYETILQSHNKQLSIGRRRGT